MATDTTASEATSKSKASTPVAATSFDLTLDEFCTRLSKKNGSEIVGGFHHSQTAAGVLKSSEAAFTAAFDAFCNQPA